MYKIYIYGNYIQIDQLYSTTKIMRKKKTKKNQIHVYNGKKETLHFFL